MQNAKIPTIIGANKMKKIAKVGITLAIIFVVICLSALGAYWAVQKDRQNQLNKYDFAKYANFASKTVLFIGDGMGENHIKNAEIYNGATTYISSLTTHGLVTTFSNSVVAPTDSAAAASALACGKKFDNKEVSRHNGVDVKNISEYAKEKGLGVGIVTTDSLSGATPACFSSHANNRGDTSDIVSGQINSNVDLFLGAGKDTYANYKSQFESKGYTFASDYSALSTENTKIVGSFESVPANEGSNAAPTLEMLTSFAIDFFETHFASGYFLMIEGAHIDKKSHANEILPMIEYLTSFDNSVKYVANVFEPQNDTAIIVTADHETGGLKLATNKEGIKNSLYTRGGHSSKNVPFFAKFSANRESLITLPDKLDNTDIFKLCKALLIG